MAKLEEVNKTIDKEEDKLRVDFLQVHYYHHVHDINHLKNYLETLWNKYQKPIWITEWALKHNYWGGKQRPYCMEQQAAFMREVIPLLESLDYVERYIWFGSYGDKVDCQWKTNLMDSNDNLTILGKSFRDLPYNKLDCMSSDQVQMHRESIPDRSDALLAPRSIEPFNISNLKTNPNPSKGLINVSLQAVESTSLNMQIVGLDGKVYFNETIGIEENTNQLQLNLSHLSNGLYLLKLKDNKHTYGQKIKILR